MAFLEYRWLPLLGFRGFSTGAGRVGPEGSLLSVSELDLLDAVDIGRNKTGFTFPFGRLNSEAVRW
jgi:hypothetical protein